MSPRDLLKPWTATRSDPFDIKKAGHLLRRAAFGGTLSERRDMVRAGVDEALARVCEPGDGEDVDAMFDEVVALDDTERLRAYRMWRILAGPHRLRERMSYFWHGHFATSDQKVGHPAMMARHLAVFDRLGLATFDELLLEISRDPAMLRWLDNESNVKGSPNENYAREIFELFALGRGNYTEHDIREAARSFTGWHIRDDRFHFNPRRHDDGTKELFGESGRFAGEDVVAIAVRQPAHARFIARELLAFFVHPEPSEPEIDAVAACYRDGGRDIGATVRTLLRSRLFFNPRAWRSRIKDPVDLVAGTVRSLGVRAAPAGLADAAAAMGQVLCEPPSVEGWHTERAWITSATWLVRSNFAAELFGGRRYGMSPSAEEVLGDARDAQRRAADAISLLLDGAISERSRAALDQFVRSPATQGAGSAAAILHAVHDLPEAQLL